MRRKPRRDSYPAKGRAAGADRRRSCLTSLPSGERADHADLPVNKEARVGLGELFKKASCPRRMTCEALKLPHRPSPQHLIDVTKEWTEGLWHISSVIFDPAPKERIDLASDVGQRHICSAAEF